jgi:beta-xylosidase
MARLHWAFFSLLQVAASLAPPARTFTSPGNPILGDGSYYSSDPAPFVVNDTLYILAGRDEAPKKHGDFVMNEWQVFSTKNPSTKEWVHHPNIATSNGLFSWASTGRAFAAQIVPAKNGKYYMYAPVFQTRTPAKDKYAIGVGVSDSPVGPFRDVHREGPIISQVVPPPGNNIQNIDPTVYTDDDGKSYIYFGTFGQLKGYELAPDMVNPKPNTLVTVRSLTGFFEAAWLFKRKGTYYMIYAANNEGPNSPCTKNLYYACQAWGTSPGPLGPWKYRGVLLDIVSSTTSHAGAIQFKGQWYLTYHTADAVGGGTFRRSIAIDRLEWDDTVQPPAIRKIKQTKRPGLVSKPPAAKGPPPL